MLLSALLAKSKIEYAGRDVEIDRIVCDSRAATESALFVCIRGFAGDGHAYAAGAYACGCRAFLAETPLDLPEDAAVIYAENTRIALAVVSAAFYDFPAEKLRVVGITGTKGKTTTAQMLTEILRKNDIPTGYIGTSGIDFGGNHYETKNTTPDSLSLQAIFADMVEAGVQVAVIEVSSQALYLDRVYGIPFAAVAFTNLAPDHIGGIEHPTFAHYRDCKKKLFCEYRSTYAVFPTEDAHAAYMADGCRAICSTYGLHSGEYSASQIEFFAEDGGIGVRFTIHHFAKSATATLPMPGTFNVQNALCAVALADRLGVSLSAAAAALATVSAEGRFETVHTSLPAMFIVDYAHNGVSLESVLTALRAYQPKKLWCVVGSVGGRTEMRRAEIGAVVSRLCDAVVLTADNPDYEDPTAICEEIRAAFVQDTPCHIFPDRADAIRYVAEHAGAGEIVLLAGKGHEQYQLIRGERVPFSERKLLEKFAMEAAMV